MRTILFLLTIIASLFLWYYAFRYLEFDSNLVYAPYNSNIFEAIFFVWLFALWFYLGRFFCFKDKKNVKDEEVSFVRKNKYNNSKNKKKTNPFILEDEKVEDDDFDFSFDSVEDDLKIIEWIGPKVEEVLKRNNIKTLKKLSESGYGELKDFLEAAGDNYKIINPRSWSYQAELAVKKQWDKLKDYQDFLIAWVEPESK